MDCNKLVRVGAVILLFPANSINSNYVTPVVWNMASQAQLSSWNPCCGASPGEAQMSTFNRAALLGCIVTRDIVEEECSCAPLTKNTKRDATFINGEGFAATAKPKSTLISAFVSLCGPALPVRPVQLPHLPQGPRSGSHRGPSVDPSSSAARCSERCCPESTAGSEGF